MKRYDSYKNSGVEWIGEIPNTWKVSRVKKVF
jgi:type I restriction enzyme S subunit